MTQITERRSMQRPVPDEAPDVERRPASQAVRLFRILGALTLAAVGAVHLEQYFVVYFRVVPVIGPLFLLNFAGAVAIALLLLLPTGRHRALGPLLALGGVGIAATSLVFLLLSEQRGIFGFEEYGYRTAVVVAIALEAAAAVVLTVLLSLLARRRSR
jgi:hypothetical protein